MNGKSILFLAHRIPFPPDRGDKIRSHHLLRHLARLGPVHAGCLADDARDLSFESELAAITASHCVVRRAMPLPVAGIAALWRGEPVSLAAFRDERLMAWVRATIAREKIGTVFVFSGQMGQYVPDDFTGRVVVDLVDVDSAKFAAYATQGFGPRRWIDAREARLLAVEEQRLAERADHTLLISDAEAALFLSRIAPARPVRVRSLANGIDTALFDPAAVAPEPALSGTGAPQIVFTGQMDYPPNIAAAQRLANLVLPLIRSEFPQAQGHIVGRAPTDAVRRLDGRNGCRVWGEVPDVRPFLAAADLVLVPLAIARGVQNKVLEAMAMARPVVLTPDAATGIHGRDGEHFAIGRDDTELAARAIALLESRSAAHALGHAARAFVQESYSWAGVLAPLAGLLGLDDETRRDGRAAA